MLKTTLAIVLLTLAPAYLTGADTLSVVPLAKALKNSDFLAKDAQKVKKAAQDVANLLVNRPDDDEFSAFSQRLQLFAKHADTRVGQLFFAALGNVPDVENVDADAKFVKMRVEWPLELGANVLVLVSYKKTESGWLIEEASVQILGAAASIVAAAGPYLSQDAPDLELLDKPELGYLVGRNPSEEEFDFESHVSDYFSTTSGDFAAVLKTLAKDIRPEVSREIRLKTLMAHLISEEERTALKKQEADDSKRAEFWKKYYQQVKNAQKWAKLAAFPDGVGTVVKIDIVGKSDVAITAQRLENGKVGIRGGTTIPEIHENNDDEAKPESD